MQGLQVKKFICHPDAVVEDDKGEYVLFSDYNTLHESAQVSAGKALALKAENITLREEHPDFAAWMDKAHELEIENAELMGERDRYKQALETIASKTEDLVPPYRNVPASVWERTAKAALAPKINHEPITEEEKQEVLGEESERESEAMMRGEV